jgi:hypothetical protein
MSSIAACWIRNVYSAICKADHGFALISGDKIAYVYFLLML